MEAKISMIQSNDPFFSLLWTYFQVYIPSKMEYHLKVSERQFSNLQIRLLNSQFQNWIFKLILQICISQWNFVILQSEISIFWRHFSLLRQDFCHFSTSVFEPSQKLLLDPEAKTPKPDPSEPETFATEGQTQIHSDGRQYLTASEDVYYIFRC